MDTILSSPYIVEKTSIIISQCLFVAGIVLSVYFLLLAVRLFLAWFGKVIIGINIDILKKITDPYLNFFEKNQWFKNRKLNYAHVVSLFVLDIIILILFRISANTTISAGLVLSYILGAIWFNIAAVIIFLLLCVCFRFITLLRKANSIHPLILSMDRVLQPLLQKINQALLKKQTSYKRSLFYTCLVLFLSLTAGNLLIHTLTRVVIDLPI